MTTFDAERCREALDTERYGRSLTALSATESTMDDARAAAEQGAPDGHVVVADHQRNGRGSHGRAWSSPAGTDLYFSLVLRPTLTLSDLPPLTLAVGLAVAQTLEALLNGSSGQHRVHIKWPNDVFVDEKKCAGILVETRSIGAAPAAVIVGVGVNVNRLGFEPELASASTSLALALGAAYPREPLLAQVLGALERQVTRFSVSGPAGIAADVDARLLHRGETVRVDDVRGTLTGVSPEGALCVTDERGV
ncbi:MAG: biotin--[acetyl-CoA-carboxylase] ligase, partial [Myxococcales bacterium]|nr:biotin--[acetyl-CoA-carboxylase] ligase [Myxococcales bacterium]